MTSKIPIRKNLIIQNIEVESTKFAFYFSYSIFEVVENNCDKIPVPFNPVVQIPILRCKFRSITRVDTSIFC